MIPYVTNQDIEQAVALRTLIELSNDDPAADAPDQDNIDLVVSGAQELVDGFLRARYRLPLDPVPTVIRELTLNLVRYRLYARRPESPVPETIKDQHAAAMRVLEQIQSGKVTLGVEQTAQAVAESGAMRVGAPARQFDDRVLDKWR